MKVKSFAIASCLLTLAVHAGAQGLYNKGATISIAPQTIVVIPDSLVNNGTLINNGDLRISGAWINQATYNPAAGQINFNSNLTQVINHNAQSVGKLTISGGGEKQFLADITVENELRLETGVLTSVNNSKIILTPKTSIVGGGNNAHIKGPVQQSGTGDWLFPIGDGVNYLPVRISGVTNAAASAVVTLHDLQAGEELTNEQDLYMSRKRYWNVVATGKLGDALLTLPLDDEDGLTPNTDFLVLAGSTKALGPYEKINKALVTGDLATGTLTAQGIDGYSNFAAAAVPLEKGIVVYNALSPNGDTANETLIILNIEAFPNNKVSIVNRWGDRVFETTGYHNDTNNFKGESKSGAKLPAGTYYYTISPGDGSALITGYLVIK